MEQKIVILESLKIKKGASTPSYRNVEVENNQKFTSKLFKHSKKELTCSVSSEKTEDVLESPKKLDYSRIFSSKKNNTVKSFLSNNCIAKKKKKGFLTKSFFKMILNKKPTESSEEMSSLNNEETVQSVTTEHSNDIICGSSKEKTEGNNYYSNQINKEHKDLDRNRNSMKVSNSFDSMDDNNTTQNILNSATRNIPDTVQEWINHLPSESSKNSLDSNEIRDNKAEAVNITVSEPPLLPAKLSREASLQSNSSLDSLLDSRRPDPVEIFLNLGFGSVPGVDMENCRIPKRFLVPSKCKGGDWNEFLKRELIQAQNFECSSLGFRGLSGPSYRRPSAIVANIMEKLRERSISQPYNKSKFSFEGKKISFDNSQSKLSLEFQSVLSPDSRKFLENQGKKSPEVTRRRIIFGQKSFAYAHNGEFVEVDNTENNLEPRNQNSSALLPKNVSENLIKLRRSSLQKQKKVEEDEDDDEDEIGDNSNSSGSYCIISNKCSTKDNNKIPRRFLSSSSLKTLEVENNLSRMMRREVEMEIRTLSQKIKDMSDRDLVSVLTQVKQLRSALENTTKISFEI